MAKGKMQQKKWVVPEEEDVPKEQFPEQLYEMKAWPVKMPKDHISSWYLDLGKGLLVLASLAAGVLVVPFLFLGSILFGVIPRIIISFLIWIRFRHEGVKMLSPSHSLSAAGYEFYTLFFVVRGECRMDKIRERFQALLDSGNYPGLRHRLVSRMGYACLQEVDVQLKTQVTFLEEERQPKIFQLLQGQFKYDAFKNLRPDAPQWEALVVPKFVYDLDPPNGEDGLYLHHQQERDELPEDEPFYAVAFRAHAATLDKPTALRMFREGLVDKKDWEVTTEKRTKPETGFLESCLVILYTVILFTWRFFLRIWQGIPVSLGEYKSTETAWKGDPYLLNATRNLNLEAIRMAKDRTKTTVTSFLTSLSAGVARNLLLCMDKGLPPQFRAAIKQFPLTRDASSPSSFTASIPTSYHCYPSYPLDRLHATFYTISGTSHDRVVIEAEKHIDGMLHTLASLFPLTLSRSFYKALTNVQIVVEIWGLEGPFTICGDVVADVFTWNAIAGTTADFGVTVTTYNGSVKANFIGDNESLRFGSKVRYGILPEEFQEEYTQVMYPCDVKPDLLFKPFTLHL